MRGYQWKERLESQKSSLSLLWYCRFADVNAGSQGPSPRGLRSRVIILGVVGGWTPSKGGANKIRIVTQKRKLPKTLLHYVVQ